MKSAKYADKFTFIMGKTPPAYNAGTDQAD